SRRESVVEELVVGTPPERIVDDRGSGQHSVLEVGAIERDVLRNAIYDDVVLSRLIHADAANDDTLGGHARALPGVDLSDQRAWKRVLHPIEYAYLLDAH